MIARSSSNSDRDLFDKLAEKISPPDIGDEADPKQSNQNRLALTNPTSDDLFCLLIRLYIYALEKEKLMHFFIADLNIFEGNKRTDFDFEGGIKKLKSIKTFRVNRMLDFRDFWSNRRTMQCCYVFVLFLLVVTVVLVGCTTAGSVWLMNQCNTPPGNITSAGVFVTSSTNSSGL